MPEHPQGQAVDPILNRGEEMFKGPPVPLTRPADEILERLFHRRTRHAKGQARASLSCRVVSSCRRTFACSANAPSTCSRGTGGASRTKLYNTRAWSSGTRREKALPTLPSVQVMSQSTRPDSNDPL